MSSDFITVFSKEILFHKHFIWFMISLKRWLMPNTSIKTKKLKRNQNKIEIWSGWACWNFRSHQFSSERKLNLLDFLRLFLYLFRGQRFSTISTGIWWIISCNFSWEISPARWWRDCDRSLVWLIIQYLLIASHLTSCWSSDESHTETRVKIQFHPKCHIKSSLEGKEKIINGNFASWILCARIRHSTGFANIALMLGHTI